MTEIKLVIKKLKMSLNYRSFVGHLLQFWREEESY